MRALHCGALVLAAVLWVARAARCPPSASPKDGMCMCPTGTACKSPKNPNACGENLDGADVFEAAQCADCSCVPEALVHEVLTPSTDTTCFITDACPITWHASVTVDRVDVHLLRVVTSGGTSKPQLERTLASAINNTGALQWRVPQDVESSESYMIAVVASTNLIASAQSPVFAIAPKPTGTCAPGHVSDTGSYPGCTPCGKGTYADASQTKCMACPKGWTTPSLAASSSSNCSLDTASPLAPFVKYPMRHIRDQDIHQLTGVTLERCARICLVDLTCKSFDFISSGASGTCFLSADTKETSLTHSFVVAPDKTTAHYERSDNYGKLRLPAVAFTKTPDTHIRSAGTTTAVSEHISLEACAALCIHSSPSSSSSSSSSSCKAFAVGKGARSGECFLYSQNSTDVPQGRLILSAAHQLDLYDLDLSSPPCEPGDASPTARAPCTPCPTGTYSTTVPRYTCSLCPASHTTATPGSASRDECRRLTCPPPSTGPDQRDDCVCPTGSTCNGDGCTSDANTGAAFFPATCSNCSCTEPKQPPTIDSVLTPVAGAKLYYGTRTNITWQASNGVSFVSIRLYQELSFYPGYLSAVSTIIDPYPNTGTYEWSISSRIAASNSYYVVIFHNAVADEQQAPTYRVSGPFYVGPAPTGPCPRGEYNPTTGASPCSLCPRGTYWVDTRTCASCPNGTSTPDVGAQTVDDCTLSATSALLSFEKRPNTYIKESNQGGEFLEEADHLTVEECARRCLDDAGCKSFDAGVVGLFQEGDCFLSYDNPDTAAPGRVRHISQLDLYVRRDAHPVLDRTFTKVPNAYLRERDDGGLFQQQHSPEACAQLCLNDVCCKSFDAGQIGTSKEYDCYLSYHNRNDAPEDFIQDASQLLDYYEKKIDMTLIFNVSYDAIITNDATKSSFESQVVSAIQALSSVEETARIVVAVSPLNSDNNNNDNNNNGDDRSSAERHIQAAVMFLDDTVKGFVEDAVTDGSLEVQFPPLFGAYHTAAFGPQMGPCGRGTISPTGDKTDACTTCRAGTYTNLAQTVCLSCPDGTTSTPGATNANQCTAADDDSTRGLFNVGDEWVGHFSAACRQTDGTLEPCTGRLSFEVVQASGTTLRLYATFAHGQFCTTALGCRSESAGVSEFYYTVRVSDNHFSARYVPGSDGWGGITDRTFVRENIDAVVGHADDGSLVLTGAYGDSGEVRVQRRCSVEYEPTTFNPGDKWIGSYHCSPRATDGSKRPEGVEDVQRMEVFISSVDPATDTITAVVDFDHYKGIGQYKATAVFSSETTCFSVEFTPTPDAWLTPHPRDVHAHQLAGRLSDDGEVFSGQLNRNPHCECSGQVSDELSQRGGSCDAWDGGSDKWCYVDRSCPVATRDPDFPSLFRATCGAFPDCTDFHLTRICSVAQPECEHGYTRVHNRCYKALPASSSPSATQLLKTTFASAQAACEREGGNLVSVHSGEESNGVVQLLAGSGAASAWLGLRQEGNDASYAWTDGTPFSNSRGVQAYADWQQGYPSQSGNGCAFLDLSASASTSDQPLWRDGPCDTLHAVVCEKLSPVVNASCVCTGQTNAEGEGAACGAWCYTSQYCPRAVQDASDPTLYWAACPFSPSSPASTTASATATTSVTGGEVTTAATTAAPTTVTTTTATAEPTCHESDPSTYTRDDGTCAACTAAGDCDADQVLLGDCGEFTTPVCVKCDSTCGSCSDLGADHCTSCAEGYLWSLDRKRCIATCPVRQFADSVAGQCKACHATCATCAGAGAGACRSCSAASGLYLMRSSSEDDRGACTAACEGHTYASEETQACEPCRTCSEGVEFEQTPCTTSANAECARVTDCDDTQYEAVAPTPTSDRECRALSLCRAGEYETAPATATSERECTPCPAGTTDDDVESADACAPCEPGTHTAPGHVGACPPCAAGTADDDSDPATECAACTLGETFSAEPGTTTCTLVDECPPGTEQALPPTVTRNRVCARCTKGTFNADATNGTRCQPWRTCAAGFEPSDSPPSALRDRTCVACATASDGGALAFKANEGNFACSPVTPCTAGTEQVSAPTTTSDRMCKRCPSGSFSPGAGAPCQEWTTCVGDEFISFFGNGTHDRVCTPRQVCEPAEEEWAVGEPGPREDRVCAPLTQCKYEDERSPEYELRAPVLKGGMFVTDRTCAACRLSCPGGQAPAMPCTRTSDTLCANCTECGANEWEYAPCTTMSDTVCRNCTSCGSGFYQKMPCSRDTDTVCAEISTCMEGQYQVRAPTPASDRRCANATVCGRYEIEVSSPTDTTDRVCRACDGTTEFFNSSACVPVSDCSAGETQSEAPTPSSDRVCAPCPSKHFKAVQRQEACQPWGDCNPGEVVATKPTATSDRVCRMCDPDKGEFSSNPTASACNAATVCEPGTFVDRPLTSSQDRRCKPCPDGTFSATENMASCTAVPPCSAGEGLVSAATPSSNRVCAPCLLNTTFSASPALQACGPVSECAPGYEEDAPPTLTTDRTCVACTPKITFKAEAGQAPCRPVLQCPAGEQERAPPTISTDRVCGACPRGTFKAASGAGKCQPHRGVCREGTYEAVEPTATNDRKCQPCFTEDNQYQDEQDMRSCKTLTTCRPGSYVSVTAQSTQNRVCATCPAGSYSDAENAATCTPCPLGEFQDARGEVKCKQASACGIGERVAVAATATQNTQCALCNGITEYQDEENREQCKRVRACNALQEEVVAPTPASNRVCKCRPGVSFSADGISNCTRVSRCTGGTVEFLPATPTSDRVCIERGASADLLLRFDEDFALLADAEEERTFLRFLFAALHNATADAGGTALFFKGTLSSGSIMVDVQVSNGSWVLPLERAAEAGRVAFYWPAKQTRFVAIPVGPCSSGYISATGTKPGCTPCPANTYANADSTACVPCPSGWSSPEGSASMAACVAPPPPNTTAAVSSTTPFGTQSPQGSGDNSASSTGLIAGIVVGALVLGACVVVAAMIVRRRRSHILEPTPKTQGDTQRTAFHNPLYDDPGSLRDDGGYDNLGAAGGTMESPYDDVSLSYATAGTGYDNMAGGYADLDPAYDTAGMVRSDPGYDLLHPPTAEEGDSMQHVHGYLDVSGRLEGDEETGHHDATDGHVYDIAYRPGGDNDVGSDVDA